MTTPSQDRAAWLEERTIPTALSCVDEGGWVTVGMVCNALRQQDETRKHFDGREARIVAEVLARSGWKRMARRMRTYPCLAYQNPEATNASS